MFKAETKLQKEHPEWKVRLATMTGENGYKVAEEYCRAIAEEIVGEGELRIVAAENGCLDRNDRFDRYDRQDSFEE